MKRMRDFLKGELGASAVEFGLVFPFVLLMILGVISTSLLGGAISGMHYAVEEAARCFAVNKTTCGSSTEAVTFARERYFGPNVDPAFEATNTGCGFTVTGTATFQLDFGITGLNIPISASACYPGKTVET